MTQQFTFPDPNANANRPDPFARNTVPATGLVQPAKSPNAPEHGGLGQSMNNYAKNMHNNADVGDISSLPNNAEAEAARIAPLVPSEATTDGGMQGMINMLKNASATMSSFAPNQAVGTPELGKVAPKETAVTENVTPAPTPTPAPAAEDKKEEEEVDEIKDEDVLPLLDSLLMRGYLTDTYHIRSCVVTLRTQFFWEDQLAVTMTEKNIDTYTLRDNVGLIYQLHTLAMNLETFGGVSFPVLRNGTPEELQKSMTDRVDFLTTLPTAIILHLWKLRERFIKRVDYVMNNFERLVKAF